MELQTIVDRYAEAIEYVDLETDEQRANPRTGEIYHTSFKALSETKAVDALDAMWGLLHEGELLTPAAQRIGVRFPGVPRAKCDHVFSTDSGGGGSGQDQEEWGIEVKKIEFIGNNGKSNDFGVGKMLSPYLKDRGLLHDAARLRAYGFTRRVAVVGYAFDYDANVLAVLRERHAAASDRLTEIEQVLKRNGGSLRSRPLIEFADSILRLRGYTLGPRAEAHFDAFRSPTGGSGTIFGWEVRRPDLEPDYDSRHPW